MTQTLPSPETLARAIDHTFLRAFGPPDDITRLCAEAGEYGFASVIVNPAELEHAVRLMAGSPIPVGVTVGFPLGQNTAEVKALEARDALQHGAREIDMVINVRALQAGALDVVRADIAGVTRVCKAQKAVSKAILETCYLTDEQKRTACRIAVEAGMDFVKTSTGLATGGATVADVRLMRAAVGPAIGVKAAGGIRTLEQVLALIEAGATRIGTSSGVAIIQELRARRGSSAR